MNADRRRYLRFCPNRHARQFKDATAENRRPGCYGQQATRLLGRREIISVCQETKLRQARTPVFHHSRDGSAPALSLSLSRMPNREFYPIAEAMDLRKSFIVCVYLRPFAVLFSSSGLQKGGGR